MASKNKISTEGDVVYITVNGASELGLATYDESFLKIIQKYTWHFDKNKYLVNYKGEMLHVYAMKYWYGEALYNQMKENGFVIDHINNDHYDARISNLSFLKRTYNTAKGQTLDKEIKSLIPCIAVSIYKDFTTEMYQIAIFCNENVVDESGKPVEEIRLLYGKDYERVLLETLSIINNYQKTKRINLAKLSFSKIEIKYFERFVITEEEKDKPIIWRNGAPYLNLDCGLTYIDSIPMKKGWK